MSLVNTVRRTTRLIALAVAFSVQGYFYSKLPFIWHLGYLLSYIEGGAGGDAGAGGSPVLRPSPPSPPCSQRVRSARAPANRVRLKRQDADVFLVGNVVRKNVNKKRPGGSYSSVDAAPASTPPPADIMLSLCHKTVY